MSYKFASVMAPENLRSAVKNFFAIEYQGQETHQDYLLPDGLPSFFYTQANQGVKMNFGKGNISLQDGFYVGYSNKMVELEHQEWRATGVSIFPVYFSMIFGISPLNTINTFTRLEETEAFKEIKFLLTAPENSIEKIFEQFAKHIHEQLNRHPLSQDILKMYKSLTSPGGYRLSVEELAESLGHSTRYLHSCFMQHLGMSPKKFIKLVRFNHALKYMYDSERNVNLSSIAHEVGYHDQSHFIRDFKDICGTTPGKILTSSGSLANKFCLY